MLKIAQIVVPNYSAITICRSLKLYMAGTCVLAESEDLFHLVVFPNLLTQANKFH